jgi:hypothetical protein
VAVEGRQVVKTNNDSLGLPHLGVAPHASGSSEAARAVTMVTDLANGTREGPFAHVATLTRLEGFLLIRCEVVVACNILGFEMVRSKLQHIPEEANHDVGAQMLLVVDAPLVLCRRLVASMSHRNPPD